MPYVNIDIFHLQNCSVFFSLKKQFLAKEMTVSCKLMKRDPIRSKDSALIFTIKSRTKHMLANNISIIHVV